MLTNKLIINEVKLTDFINKLDMRVCVQIYNINNDILCSDWLYEVYQKLTICYKDYYVIDINIFSSCVSLVVCTKDELREYQKRLESKNRRILWKI